MIKHKFVSAVAPTGPPGVVTPTNWNDVHDSRLVSTAYAMPAAAAATDEVIECTGTGILTMVSAAANAGLVQRVINVGSGVITMQDAAAATFNGDATYILANQWQAVTVQSNGTRWNVIAQAN